MLHLLRWARELPAHDGLPPGAAHAAPPGVGPAGLAQCFQALAEAFGVALLSACKRFHPLGDLVEAFVASCLREAGIHLGVLVGLARNCRTQVVVGRANGLACGGVANLGEIVEVAKRVTRLAFGGRTKQRRNVGVALDVGLLREVEVAPIRLALASEGFLQVLVSLCAFQGGPCFSLCRGWFRVVG